MLPTEDIIPITFYGGTGGNFLCHFIVSAKRNMQDVANFSKYGNAHENCLKDVVVPNFGISQPDSQKINFLLNQAYPYYIVEKPYYTSVHIADINLITANFNRSIRITYELSDLEEIVAVFYGKFVTDSHFFLTNMKPQTPEHIKQGIIKWQSTFTKIENLPNVLFISWKELFKGNIEEFITKLSIFTDIDAENFSTESLIHWRNKTQYCLDKFSITK
jgi:hypothetical protein